MTNSYQLLVLQRLVNSGEKHTWQIPELRIITKNWSKLILSISIYSYLFYNVSWFNVTYERQIYICSFFLFRFIKNYINPLSVCKINETKVLM